jgi:hypothetical protein
MTAYYNNLFKADPELFVNTYTVDIKTWFESLVRSLSPETRKSAALCEAANAMGACRADFEPVDGGFFGKTKTVQLRFVPNEGFDAYWVPYHAGQGLPGWSDVIKVNPPSKFVFTAGMNGCAFVVTDSPKGAAYMRVYHNQHPDDNGIMQSIHNVGQPVISFSGFEDQGGAPLPQGMNPVAFNCLYYRNGAWNYIFQPQAFNALSQAPARRLPGRASMRSVF